MSKPEKAGTDDLKRMLRRLERIETEKADRTQARPSNPAPRTRDLSSLPSAMRRQEMAADEPPAEPAQPPRRRTLVSSINQVAPESSAPAPVAPPRIPSQLPEQRKETGPKPVSVLTDPREFTKRGGPKRQGVSAGFVILAVSVAFVATLGTIWLAGGFDRILTQYAPQGSASSGEPDGARTADVASAPDPSSQGPRLVGDERIAPDNGPSEKTDATPDRVAASEQAEPDQVPATPPSAQNSDVADDGARSGQGQPSAPSKPASDDIGPPPAPVAAMQPPQETAPSTPLPPVDPATLELVGPANAAAEPGVPLPFPVTLKAGAGDLGGYYLVVSGLKSGSSFSSGIELLYDTWQIPAKFLPNLQLTTKPGFARHMILNVELRGPSGDRLKRTTLTVDLPGAARQAVGLDGAEASGDRPPSEAAQELIDKAEVFLDNGSLQGARMLLERAATYGAGYAAMLLATSYDPRYASHFSADNPEPNAAEAKRWYQRASELGVRAAGPRLNAMDAP